MELKHSKVSWLGNWELAVLAILSVGLSVAANYLLQQNLKQRLPIPKDTPQSLSIRGSYIPRLIGIKRVGAIIGWVGDRRRGPSNWHESAWHELVVGPGTRLLKIWINGKLVFPIPKARGRKFNVATGTYANSDELLSFIDSVNFPSGSNIDLGDKIGNFDIYWGEEFQPVNTYLGDIKRVRVNSRWPFLMYVLWRDKNLGPVQAIWPLIEYEVEVKPFNSSLTLSEPWVNQVLNFDVIGRLGIPLTEIDGAVPNLYGANPAHAIEQLLFDKFPHGAGLDKTKFDMASLDTLGEVITDPAGESLPVQILIQEGASLKNVFSDILQDLTMVMPYNVVTGLIEFNLVRKSAGFKRITSDLLLAPQPEIATNHGPKPQDKLTLSFSDIGRSYRDSTIGVDQDGHARFTDSQRGKNIRSFVSTDIINATKILLRREQYDILEPASVIIKTGRKTREILPGEILILDGFPTSLRLVNTKFDTLSSEVSLECVIDTFGVTQNTATIPPGGGIDPPTIVPSPDLLNTLIELPQYLTKNIEVIFPRIRSSAAISDSVIWISGDGVTYIDIGTSTESLAGGTLAEALDASSFSFLESGPLINLVGDELNAVLNLSSDPFNWKTGRQIMLIGEEWCFLRNITVLNSAQFRPGGLIRARYGGQKLSHPVGTPVFIFRNDQLQKFSDVLFKAGQLVYIKIQPIDPAGEIPLDEILPITKEITGKALRGIAPNNLVTTNLLNSYKTGEAIPLKWDYYSDQELNKGAGAMGAGQAVTRSPLQGLFELKFLTTASVLKKTVSALNVLTYSLSNADLITAFGSQPTALKVQITFTKNGLTSGIKEITVEKD